MAIVQNIGANLMTEFVGFILYFVKSFAKYFLIFGIVLLTCFLIYILFFDKDPPHEVVVEKNDNSFGDIFSQFNRRSDPRKIESQGAFLACQALKDVIGRPVTHKQNIRGTKSDISGKELLVDCYEPITRIGVDYFPEEYYNYDEKDDTSRDVYEYYERIYLDKIKKDQLDLLGNKYIKIPYTVDTCDTGFCEPEVSLDIRKERIKKYIEEKVEQFYPMSL